MNARMNAHMVQNRKETDQQGQEITAASNSLLASIREHKEQMGVTIENLSYEISKSKDYVDSKFSTVSGEIQDIKQHSAAEISRLSVTLRDLQSKLVTGTSDRTSPAVRVDVRSEVVQQSVLNTRSKHELHQLKMFVYLGLTYSLTVHNMNSKRDELSEEIHV
jgi:hypothetical protein